MTYEIDTPKTHFNYVVAFSDGTIKVGVTRRPMARIAELSRQKAKLNVVQPVRYACTARSTKSEALKTERNLCSLFKSQGIEGCREWFEPTHYSLASNFNYFKQATSMLWSMNTGRQLPRYEVPA
jgi:predicted GIY-YIG superfamily endonuclease